MGHKTVETRLHQRFKSLVGERIAIHAAQKFDHAAYESANRYCPILKLLVIQSGGGIIGTVRVERFASLSGADSKAALIDCEFTQRFGLFLKDPILFGSMVICRGRQGIFEVEI